MVEVTLQMTEDELKELVKKEFLSIGKFDGDSAELYIQYFNNIIDNGSATFLYGPVHLRTWLLNTLESLSIITTSDEEYSEVQQLWESREFENSKFVVVAKNKTDYLIEWY